MQEKILGEILYKLFRNKKENLIEKLIENLQNEGKIHILKNVIEYLKLKNIQIKEKEPGKIFLAFDYDEKEILRLIKEKFNIDIEIVEKHIDPELILGGKLIIPNYVIDFSFKNLFNRVLFSNKWKI